MSKRRDASKSKESQKSDIPSKPWYKNTMAVVALVSATIAAITGLITLSQRLGPARVAQNTIIVFDRSLAMNGPFDGGTKLEAATEALNKVLSTEVAGADNLALRSFGGPCEGENSQIAVRFSQHNETRVRDKVQTFQADGESTLTDAMIEAIGDFSEDSSRFEGVNKRIIVITGGVDRCQDDPAKYIHNRLESLASGEGIAVSFRFIGMALDPEQQNQLTAIAEETGGLSEETLEDQLFFVNSQSELEEVLKQIVDVEPILNTANSMGTIMNSVTDHVNEAISAINDEDFAAAEEGLQAAKDEFKKTQLLLTDLGQRLSVPEFHEQLQKLYELLTENRGLQEKQLELLEAMISQGKSGDTDALNETTLEWNENISNFDSNIYEMDRITAEIVNSLREQRMP